MMTARSQVPSAEYWLLDKAFPRIRAVDPMNRCKMIADRSLKAFLCMLALFMFS